MEVQILYSEDWLCSFSVVLAICECHTQNFESQDFRKEKCHNKYLVTHVGLKHHYTFVGLTDPL